MHWRGLSAGDFPRRTIRLGVPSVLLRDEGLLLFTFPLPTGSHTYVAPLPLVSSVADRLYKRQALLDSFAGDAGTGASVNGAGKLHTLEYRHSSNQANPVWEMRHYMVLLWQLYVRGGSSLSTLVSGGGLRNWLTL